MFNRLTIETKNQEADFKRLNIPDDRVCIQFKISKEQYSQAQEIFKHASVSLYAKALLLAAITSPKKEK